MIQPANKIGTKTILCINLGYKLSMYPVLPKSIRKSFALKILVFLSILNRNKTSFLLIKAVSVYLTTHEDYFPSDILFDIKGSLHIS